jgi:hypothetical protein
MPHPDPIAAFIDRWSRAEGARRAKDGLPLNEQSRIVAKAEQLMALVDALEQQLATSRATAEKLLTALVAELAA